MAFSIVISVLEKLGLVQYVLAFKENDIDDNVLEILLKCKEDSPESKLFSAVVPSVGHRIKIFQELRLLKSQSKRESFSANANGVETDELEGAVGYTHPLGESIKNAIEFCSICTEILNMGQFGNGIKLKTCCHTYCRNCLVQYIDQRSDYQLKCPGFYNSLASNIPCSGYLILAEISEVLSPKDFQDYCERAGHADSALQFYATSKTSQISTKEMGAVPRVLVKQINLTSAAINNAAQTKNFHPRGITEINQSDFDSSVLSVVKEDEQLAIKLNDKQEQCHFCKVKLIPFEGIVLQTCFHVYCRDCLLSKIHNSNGSSVNCAIEDVTMCAGYLLEREIKSLTTSAEYSDYVKKSSQLALKGIPLYTCNNDGCFAKFELDKENQRKSFLCPVCESVNCIQCEALHDGLTCQQYSKILSDAKNARIEINSVMFKEIMDSERKDGFDYLSGTIVKFMSPDASRHNIKNISYTDTMNMMEFLNVIPTSKQFECLICANEEVSNGVILKECLHMFCRDCIENFVRHSNNPEIQCPLDTCDAIISSREIREIVTPELYEIFLNRSVTLAEKMIPNSFHCMTKDCTGWCVIEGANYFSCPVCERGNCIQCKDFHENMTCKEFQDKIADDKNRVIQREIELQSEQEVENMVQKRTFNRCPRCRYVCEKISGCNSVTCGSCKVPFTWQP